MTPLDKIKQGILTTNWNLVEEGYFGLTGNNVHCPRDNSSIPVQKTSTKTRSNLFVDNGQFHVEEKVSVNPKMGVKTENKTQRRRKVQFIEVKCNTCGKKEKVSPKLAPQTVDGEKTKYVCNSCGAG